MSANPTPGAMPAPSPWPARVRALIRPVAVGVVGMVLALLWLHPDVPGVRMAIRATATTSLLLFLCTYLAAPLAQRTGQDGWRHLRRSFGLSFALSHGLHLALVIAFALLDPAGFHAVTTPFSRISGGLAYALLGAMVITSWPGPRHWLGPRAWTWLHRAGLHYLWLSFVVAYGKRVPAMPGYALPLALVLLAGLLRLRWRSRTHTADAPARWGQAM